MPKTCDASLVMPTNYGNFDQFGLDGIFDAEGVKHFMHAKTSNRSGKG